MRSALRPRGHAPAQSAAHIARSPAHFFMPRAPSPRCPHPGQNPAPKPTTPALATPRFPRWPRPLPSLRPHWPKPLLSPFPSHLASQSHQSPLLDHAHRRSPTPPHLFSLIGSEPHLSPSPSHRAPQSHPPAHTSWPRPLRHPCSPIGSGPPLTPPPPAVPPVMAGGVPGSVAVALHPLVILNISDHWIRMRCQEGRPGQGENPMEPHRDP